MPSLLHVAIVVVAMTSGQHTAEGVLLPGIGVQPPHPPAPSPTRGEGEKVGSTAGSEEGVSTAVIEQVPCCQPCKTICVPECEKTTHTHTRFSCRSRMICLPYCPKGCYGTSGCGECGRPKQIRVLIKRFVKEEVCEVKCKPQEVPLCPPMPCDGK